MGEHQADCVGGGPLVLAQGGRLPRQRGPRVVQRLEQPLDWLPELRVVPMAVAAQQVHAQVAQGSPLETGHLPAVVLAGDGRPVP